MWKNFLDIPYRRAKKAAEAALIISFLAVACSLGQPEQDVTAATPTSRMVVAVTSEPTTAPLTVEPTQVDTTTSEALDTSATPTANPIPQAQPEPSSTPFVDAAENPPTAS